MGLPKPTFDPDTWTPPELTFEADGVRYELINPPRRGGLGVVLEARAPSSSKLSGMRLAIKFMKKGKTPEANRMIKLNSQYTGRAWDLHDLSHRKGWECNALVMTYYAVSLDGVLDQCREEGSHFERPLVFRWCKDFTHGVEYLHAQGLVHCDIKKFNLVFDLGSKGYFDPQSLVENKGTGVVIDFGQATINGEAWEPRDPDDLYAAPELKLAKPGLADPSIDAYGLGRVFQEMAGLLAEYERDSLLQIAYVCVDNNPLKRPSIPGILTYLDLKPNELAELLRRSPQDANRSPRPSVISLDAADDQEASELFRPVPLPTQIDIIFHHCSNEERSWVEIEVDASECDSLSEVFVKWRRNQPEEEPKTSPLPLDGGRVPFPEIMPMDILDILLPEGIVRPKVACRVRSTRGMEIILDSPTYQYMGEW
jgi:serine/threonine protein kinase